MNDATTQTVVVDAAGHFGDATRVWFSGPLKSAKKYAKRAKNVQILVGCHAVCGETITRAAIQTMTAAGYWTSCR